MKLHLCVTLIATAVAISFPASGALIINEVDSDSVNQPVTDAFEFVELYDTSGTSVPLDGYTLVFYNGNGNTVYRAHDLDGLSTSAAGFFVAGAVAGAQLPITANSIQNGVDAVALYLDDAVNFPNGAAVTATNLVDAIVYSTGPDVDGVGLAAALLVAGGVVDEWGRDGTAATGALDSIGRLPNGAGAARDSTSWTYQTPTPNAPNIAIPEPATVLLLASVGTLVFAARRRHR